MPMMTASRLQLTANSQWQRRGSACCMAINRHVVDNTATHACNSAPDNENEMYESISAVCDKRTRTRTATQRHARQQQQQPPSVAQKKRSDWRSHGSTCLWTWAQWLIRRARQAGRQCFGHSCRVATSKSQQQQQQTSMNTNKARLPLAWKIVVYNVVIVFVFIIVNVVVRAICGSEMPTYCSLRDNLLLHCAIVVMRSSCVQQCFGEYDFFVVVATYCHCCYGNCTSCMLHAASFYYHAFLKMKPLQRKRFVACTSVI